MKHRTLKPREYRDFLGKRPAPYLLSRSSGDDLATELSLEQHLRGVGLALRRFFENDPWTYVGYGVPIRYSSDQPELEVTPSLFVVRQATVTGQPTDRGQPYRITDSAPSPDFVLECSAEPLSKAECLARAALYLGKVGAAEYFLFFPGLEDHASLEAFRQKDGEYRRIGPWAKQWHSSRLNLDFASTDGKLHVIDARAGLQLPTPLEAVRRRFAEEGC